MPEWLIDALHHDIHIVPTVLMVRLTAAFLLGGMVAVVHRLTTGRGIGPGFLGTLVMLSVLIGLLTMVIGNSQARAFTLVGALAIVRFRTVVADTRDTAFVIYAVASGMACGTGFPLAALVATPLLAAAAWVFRPVGDRDFAGEGTLTVRLGVGSAAEDGVQVALQEAVPGYRLGSLATVRGGAALEVVYYLPMPAADRAAALVARLTRIDGVQSVELKGG
ncbi:MAG: DUF4956 domain-containing protein [Gemmataceae bacterium]